MVSDLYLNKEIKRNLMNNAVLTKTNEVDGRKCTWFMHYKNTVNYLSTFLALG